MSIEQTQQSDLISYDPTLAYFSKIDAPPTLITPQNQHLAIYNTADMRHEIARQGSGEIVDILHLIRHYANPREVALYDTDGIFYDKLILEGLHDHIKENGKRTIKHDAVFYNHETRSAFAIAVDHIYCLGGSYYPDRDLSRQINAGV